jgi:hypothetical protein
VVKPIVVKRLFAGLCSLLMASACDRTTAVLPTAPTTTVNPPPATPTGNGPTPIPATTIAADGGWTCGDGEGDLCVEGSSSGDDPTCFHAWDASGHCKQYNLVAAADGALLTTMRWAGPSRALYDPDVFLVAPDGGWTYASDAWPEKHVRLPVKSGNTYRIVVLSYGPALQAFALNLKVQHD